MRRAALPLATGLCFLAFVGAHRAECAPAAQDNQIGVAVLDFTYSDTAGEAQDMTTEHQKWLEALAAGLRKSFERTGQGNRLNLCVTNGRKAEFVGIL